MTKRNLAIRPWSFVSVKTWLRSYRSGSCFVLAASKPEMRGPQVAHKLAKPSQQRVGFHRILTILSPANHACRVKYGSIGQ